jgi:hypothetical protein
MQPLKTIGHRKYIGSMSAKGYPGAPTFSPPDTQPPNSRPAYGWHPQASTVPLGNPEFTQRVIASMVVGVPDVTIYAPGDLVILNGKDYIVSEDVRDYTTGPFGTGPGGEIIVESVTG